MQPILFTVLGLPLYAYGAMLCASVIIGRHLALRRAARAGLEPALMDRCCLWTLAGAVVGARLLFVVTNLDQFAHVTDVFRVWTGGVVAYGGFLGGFAGAAVFCRRHRIPLLAWADCAAPSLCIGLALTRVGCFLAGCDFGRPWSGAWAVRFPAGSPAYTEQALQGLLPAGATTSLAVHPTQIYESLAGLALLALVTTVYRRRAVSGQAFGALVIGYGVLRFLIETVRADAGRGFVGPLSTSQFIAAITCLSASAMLYALWRPGSSSATRERSMFPCGTV